MPISALRNLDLLLGLENRIVFTAQEVLAETCRLEQALVKHKQEPNLALLPAGNPQNARVADAQRHEGDCVFVGGTIRLRPDRLPGRHRRRLQKCSGGGA